MPLHLASCGTFDICSQRERHHLCPMVFVVALTPLGLGICWVLWCPSFMSACGWGFAWHCYGPLPKRHIRRQDLIHIQVCILRDIVQWLLLFSFIFFWISFFSLLVFFVKLFDFTLAAVFVCFNNVITVFLLSLSFLDIAAFHYTLEVRFPKFRIHNQKCPIHVKISCQKVGKTLKTPGSQFNMAAPLINLKWKLYITLFIGYLDFFRSLKRWSWQYCAMSTSTYIVFVLSCANYYELCCYMHVLAKSVTAIDTFILIFHLANGMLSAQMWHHS